ncbi:hypothetical protein EUGRSUZ_G01527 [Eucalyptus grandis]|uniref:Uncharacterized protein n=2 Tax=Eucalyptus grandis TaxID=71139 RepID=A0ACC3K5B2_EUCGR|nr:hypothetical protein EUGRSUZ_G01527 [Eucalyptus grandis]
MNVEVQWKKLVKPSVPTPNNRQKLKLSSVDEIQMPNYTGIIFSYRDNAENHRVDIPQRLGQMEESLFKTPQLFYPMARRYVEDDGCFIECNDPGVEFIHAKVDGQMDKLLHGDPDMDLLDHLSTFPTNVVGNSLVAIQVKTFECGRLVIGLRFTRKIGDISTMAMFIHSWAAACRGTIDMAICPSFELSSLFHMKEAAVPNWPPPRTIGTKEFVMTSFRKSKLFSEYMGRKATSRRVWQCVVRRRETPHAPTRAARSGCAWA